MKTLWALYIIGSIIAVVVTLISNYFVNHFLIGSFEEKLRAKAKKGPFTFDPGDQIVKANLVD